MIENKDLSRQHCEILRVVSSGDGAIYGIEGVLRAGGHADTENEALGTLEPLLLRGYLKQVSSDQGRVRVEITEAGRLALTNVSK